MIKSTDTNRVAVMLVIETNDIERVERFVKNLKERNPDITRTDVSAYDEAFCSPVIYFP